MTRVSLNELAVRVSRALQGLGLPAGVADDAAWIVAWHDVAGLDGINQLLAAIPRLRAAAGISAGHAMDATGTEFDANGGSLLTLGGSLVDLLELGDTNAGQPLTLGNAQDTALIGGVAALAADRGLAATFHADARDAAYDAVSDGTAVDWACTAAGVSGDARPGAVRCWRTAEATPWPPANAYHVLDATALSERRQTALRRGVAVDTDAWAEIYDLAKQVLVDDSGG